MSHISVCKNVITSNNKRNWKDSDPNNVLPPLDTIVDIQHKLHKQHQDTVDVQITYLTNVWGNTKNYLFNRDPTVQYCTGAVKRQMYHTFYSMDDFKQFVQQVKYYWNTFNRST